MAGLYSTVPASRSDQNSGDEVLYHSIVYYMILYCCFLLLVLHIYIYIYVHTRIGGLPLRCLRAWLRRRRGVGGGVRLHGPGTYMYIYIYIYNMHICMTVEHAALIIGARALRAGARLPAPGALAAHSADRGRRALRVARPSSLLDS